MIMFLLFAVYWVGYFVGRFAAKSDSGLPEQYRDL